MTDARSIITDTYDKDWSNYTVELDATKLAGAEGFLVGFAANAADNFYWWNLGGWNNTRSVLERASGSRQGEVAAAADTSLVTGQTYHLKIVVEGRTIELYADGELKLTYTEPSVESLYQVVTHDEETGEYTVKVVNPFATTARTTVNVDDAVDIASSVKVTEMVADPTAMNTKDDPTNVVPVNKTWEGGSNSFTYDFPAYSVTFLRLSEEPVVVPEVAFDATAIAQCRGQKSIVSVSLTNNDTGMVDFTLESAFGTDRVKNLRPGKTKEHVIITKQASIEAGTVSVTATIDGRSETVELAYPAAACGRQR